MAPFPPNVTGVERKDVHRVVRTMLRNEEVGDVDCLEQTNHKYKVSPRRRIPPPAQATASTRRKRKKTVSRARKKTA